MSTLTIVGTLHGTPVVQSGQCHYTVSNYQESTLTGHLIVFGLWFCFSFYLLCSSSSQEPPRENKARSAKPSIPTKVFSVSLDNSQWVSYLALTTTITLLCFSVYHASALSLSRHLFHIQMEKARVFPFICIFSSYNPGFPLIAIPFGFLRMLECKSSTSIVLFGKIIFFRTKTFATFQFYSITTFAF